ncbi:hypothetical protein PH5382_02829 [Phaeobacter sp. CECT 5382]|uniref:ABC transporter substrate-binding protein n=1 Tax=Phaeobacter sp. CECT 5382 TaxID=1712645 RepID=UPI0006DA5E3A|nr:ABC transporter substrate-binding protein [Phaeobacter sp. CECT 5382]CUH88885.1 hypothetical protein PH5382_02829 [Phaeobacter sp. CECT 5382]
MSMRRLLLGYFPVQYCLAVADFAKQKQVLFLASEPLSDAIFNVTFGGDLAKFVREGSIRYLFEDRAVVSLLTGEPEYLTPLGAETPDGWIVTGYPGADIATETHERFASAYVAKFGEDPKTGSILGYNSVLTIAAALCKAGST